jgi:hypothetical protein
MNQGNKKMNLHKIIPKIFMVVLWLTMTSVAYATVYEYDEVVRDIACNVTSTTPNVKVWCERGADNVVIYASPQ